MTNTTTTLEISRQHLPDLQAPWVAIPDDDFWCVANSIGTIIFAQRGPHAESIAGLIASAPRMLKALELIIEILPSGSQPWEINAQEMAARDIACAAVEKAKGLAA